MKPKRKLRVGDWVEVRSKEEILKTLDAQGTLDGMIFMPEMFQYCGQKFQVYKRAHKTCDYSTPYPYRTRRLEDTVHLNTRCDGHAHDNCEAGCLLYWKTQWLKTAGDGMERPFATTADRARGNGARPAPEARCSETFVFAKAKIPGPDGGLPTYVCQATHVQGASKPLAWWDVRQYFEDYSSGNVGLERLFSGFVYSCYYHLSQAGIGLGPATRWFYNTFHSLWGGTLFPRTPGRIPEGEPTPSKTLNLVPGELVRVKSHEEILKTVDSRNRNRGMYWDAELVPYCGGTYRVAGRVNRLIDEKSAKMVEMKNACVILDGVVCQARYSPCRMLCPKSMYPYWREIWLERVEAKDHGAGCKGEEAKLLSVGQ
jgi:hypothetical protein